jgi:integrase
MELTKRQIIKNGKPKWEVDFGLDDLGVRRRPYFKSEGEADDAIERWHKDLKAGGEYWARMTKVEQKSVVSVLEEARREGKSIREVWEDWKRWKKDNANTAVEPKAYREVVDEWGRRKRAAGKTERYVHDATGLLMHFGKGREQQPIHAIAASDLEAWIDSHKTWGKSSRRTNMSLFANLWETAMAKGWCSLNIVERMEPVGKIGREVKIYPNETTLHIMAAALENDLTKQVIAPLALGFFGCMRPEEIQSSKAIRAKLPKEKWFGWQDIDLKHGLITVRVEIAKTGDQRTIRLQPCAVEWLNAARELGNPLPPHNETKLIDQVCDLICLDEWIRDGLRKNCVTHLRAVYKNDYDVVKDCGNSIRIMLRHYADLHTPAKVSLDHWKITPKQVNEFRQTKKWQQFLEDAAKRLAKKREANNQSSAKPTESSRELSEPSASGSAKPGH